MAWLVGGPVLQLRIMFERLAHSLDFAVEVVLHSLAGVHVPDPLSVAITHQRREKAEQLQREAVPQIEQLTPGILVRDPRAIEAYDRLIEQLIGSLRAFEPKGMHRWLGTADKLLYENREELLDNPNFSKEGRLRVLTTLDKFNENIGSYACWTQELSSLINRAQTTREGPVRVYDLAAGHAGFALYLKEHLGSAVAVTATDLVDEYLDEGRPRAAQRGVDVQFAIQDATNLANIDDEQVDLFLCTQSLHHFSPGMVARIFGEAARKARVGVCFVDGERGVLPLMFIIPVMSAYGRAWPVVHDSVVSVRRMFTEQELWLLASLAPGLPTDCHLRSKRIPPGHALVAMQVAGT
jgi:hypothetical protein